MHLHRICGGLIIYIENFENGKWSRWLHVVPEINFRESELEFNNVVHAGVVVLEVLVPQEIVDGVARQFILGVNIMTKADDNIHSDLGVRIDDLTAFFNGGDEVGVPGRATIDGCVRRVNPRLIWKHKRDGSRRYNGSHGVGTFFIPLDV